MLILLCSGYVTRPAPCRRERPAKSGECRGGPGSRSTDGNGLNAPFPARTGEENDAVNPCRRSGRATVKARRWSYHTPVTGDVTGKKKSGHGPLSKSRERGHKCPHGLDAFMRAYPFRPVTEEPGRGYDASGSSAASAYCRCERWPERPAGRAGQMSYPPPVDRYPWW